MYVLLQILDQSVSQRRSFTANSGWSS